MSAKTRTLPVVALPLLLAVTGATAQQLDLQSPTPESSRERGPFRHDETGIRSLVPESSLYPHRPAVPYQPAFVEPLTKELTSGRLGVAGWTSPNTAAGARVSADPENPGWPSLGFAVEWGSPKKMPMP